MADMVIFMILDAQSAQTHALTMGILLHPAAMSDPLFEHKMKMNDDAVYEIVQQDLHVDRHEAGRHIGDGHCVERDDPVRFPDQAGGRGVGDGLAVERGPDPA